MIGFHKLTIQDVTWMRECQKKDTICASDLLFTSLFAWQTRNAIAVARIKECAVVRFYIQKTYVYSFPIGQGDKQAIIGELLQHCQKRSKQLQLAPLSDEQCKQLRSWYPGQFTYEAPRYACDYIYQMEDLRDLKGKKYQSKRNFIHRFMENDDYSYEPLTVDNFGACIQFQKIWMRQKKERTKKKNKNLRVESAALKRVLAHYEQLHLVGALLRKSGKCVAYTIAEPQNADTIAIHFEKADASVPGAYAMINWLFIKNACEGYRYINREDDEGDDGLRKSKLSYHPYALVSKYIARAIDV